MNLKDIIKQRSLDENVIVNKRNIVVESDSPEIEIPDETQEKTGDDLRDASKKVNNYSKDIKSVASIIDAIEKALENDGKITVDEEDAIKAFTNLIKKIDDDALSLIIDKLGKSTKEKIKEMLDLGDETDEIPGDESEDSMGNVPGYKPIEKSEDLA